MLLARDGVSGVPGRAATFFGDSPAAASRPRVLFAINSLAGGGAERVFTSLLTASEGRRNDCEMAVVLLDEDPPGYDLPNWMPSFRLDCGHSQLRSFVRMGRLIRAWKPNLTVSFLTRANIATAANMALLGQPSIVSERTDTRAQLARTRWPQLSEALVRWTYPRAGSVIAVSKGVGETLVEHYRVAPGRMEVINNPVDLARIEALGREAPSVEAGPDDVVAMGRLTGAKNFALAIRAFAASRWTGRLILLGEGELGSELRRLGDEAGLGERLVFAGFQSNPYAVIARAGMFLLTSDQEGFSNALVEAMALGVPVVATDCRFSPDEILRAPANPAAGEVVRGVGGLLVPTGDLTALLEALDRMTDPGLRADLGREGRKRVEAFDSAAIFDSYWRAFDKVLAGAVRRQSAGGSGERG